MINHIYDPSLQVQTFDNSRFYYYHCYYYYYTDLTIAHH